MDPCLPVGYFRYDDKMVLNIEVKYQPTLLTQTGQTQTRKLGKYYFRPCFLTSYWIAS